MCGDANNTIEAAPELPAGAGCQEKQNLPAKGEVFLLDIPFIEPSMEIQESVVSQPGHYLHPPAIPTNRRSIPVVDLPASPT
jgi:hypothetical protein